MVVVPATIEWQQCLLHLHFFDTLTPAGNPAGDFPILFWGIRQSLLTGISTDTASLMVFS